MARLQRKKSPIEKKKKKAAADEKSAAIPVGSGKASAAVIGDARKRAKKPARKSLDAVKAPQGKVGGAIATSMQFLREVRVELKKVTWPSRKQTVGSTIVVLILVLIISVFLGSVDFLLSTLFQTLLQ